MNLILFGFRGCGKTYYGRRLAEKLQKPFFDTDAILVGFHKGPEITPRAIYQTFGEKYFRALETEAILSLTAVQDSIIALGGGAVLNSDNLKILQPLGELIYLEAKFETIEPRVGPLRALYEERKPLYESIPARKISVEKPESHVLEELLNGI